MVQPVLVELVGSVKRKTSVAGFVFDSSSSKHGVFATGKGLRCLLVLGVVLMLKVSRIGFGKVFV